MKRTRGRPKIKVPRDTTFQLRLTDSERKMLDDAADARGMNLSAWVRLMCLDAARRAT